MKPPRMTKARMDLLRHTVRHGYAICGKHNGQSPVYAADLMALGLASGSRYMGDLIIAPTPAGRALSERSSK